MFGNIITECLRGMINQGFRVEYLKRLNQLIFFNKVLLKVIRAKNSFLKKAMERREKQNQQNNLGGFLGSNKLLNKDN